MKNLFVFVVNHCDDKKPWCTAPTKGILFETDKNWRGQIKAVNWIFVDWRQSYSRQSHIRGIKLFIVNGVCPSLIPVLTDYCRSRSMKVELHGNTSKYRNLPGSGAMGSTTMPIVFQRKTAANFWRIDLPQNWECGQYRYFLTQHQAISASNTRPDCGRLTPKVPGVFRQNQSVVQKISHTATCLFTRLDSL